jgi:hypothetical protein
MLHDEIHAPAEFWRTTGTTLGTNNIATLSSRSAWEMVGNLNAHSLKIEASGRTPLSNGPQNRFQGGHLRRISELQFS